MPGSKIVNRHDSVALDTEYRCRFKRVISDSCAAKTVLTIFDLSVNIKADSGIVLAPLPAHHATGVFTATLQAVNTPVAIVWVVLQKQDCAHSGCQRDDAGIELASLGA